MARARGVALLTVVLALPAIGARGFLSRGEEVLRNPDELGNLLRPLDPLQVAGIWPASDFRTDPDRFWLTLALVVLVALLAVAGAVFAVQRRAWAPLAYVTTSLAGAALFVAVGSPWVDGKALATASPAVLFAALIGCASILAASRDIARSRGGRHRCARRAVVERARLPRSHPRAARAVRRARGDRRAVRRPGAGADDRVSAVRRTALPPPSRPGRGVRAPPQAGPEGGRVALAERRVSRSRRARAFGRARVSHPCAASLAGRQPAACTVRAPLARPLVRGLAAPLGGSAVAAHLPLGDERSPGAAPACADVRRIARGARTIAAVARTAPSPCFPRGLRVWRRPSSSRQTGRYSLWLAGSRRVGADVYMDGQRIVSAPAHFDNAAEYSELGSVTLGPGVHTVRVNSTAAGSSREPVVPSMGSARSWSPPRTSGET